MKVPIPRIIRHDAVRKLVALFFALVIWLAVSAQLSETMVLHNVPVILEYDPTETIVESGVPSVGVTVRGSPGALEQLKSSDIRLTAEVAEVPPGVYFSDIVISRRNVAHTPPGIRVVDLDRRKIPIKLDRVVTRQEVPVNVRFEGKIREGYRRTRCLVVPGSIDIRGPHRLVKDITEVVTEPVLLDDTVVRDFEVIVPLTPIPNVKMEKSVNVSVQVSRSGTQKNYPQLPMGVLVHPGSPLQIKGELPRILVSVHGTQTALDKLSPRQIHPFVDVSAITAAGQHAATVQVWIDGGTGLTAGYIHPDTVMLTMAARAPAAPVPQPAAPAPQPAAPDKKALATPAPKPDAPK